MQIGYNPIEYCFNWTEPTDKLNPNDLGWYDWDRKEAHKQAKKARDDRYRELLKEGKTVTRFSLNSQLVTRGGIGSGHPEIEEIVTCYYLNYH